MKLAWMLKRNVSGNISQTIDSKQTFGSVKESCISDHKVQSGFCQKPLSPHHILRPAYSHTAFYEYLLLYVWFASSVFNVLWIYYCTVLYCMFNYIDFFCPPILFPHCTISLQWRNLQTHIYRVDLLLFLTWHAQNREGLIL